MERSSSGSHLTLMIECSVSIHWKHAQRFQRCCTECRRVRSLGRYSFSFTWLTYSSWLNYINFSLMLTLMIHRFTGSANRLTLTICKHALRIVSKMSRHGQCPTDYSWIQRRRKFSGVPQLGVNISCLQLQINLEVQWYPRWRLFETWVSISTQMSRWPLTLQQLSEHVSLF